MHQGHKNKLLGSAMCEHALQTRFIDPSTVGHGYQPIIRFSIIPCDLQTTPLHSSSQPNAVHTQTHRRVSPDLFHITHPHLVFTTLMMHPFILPFCYSPEYAAKHQSHT